MCEFLKSAHLIAHAACMRCSTRSLASRNSRTLLRRSIFDASVWYDDAASTPAIRGLAMPGPIPGDPGFTARSEVSFRYRRFTIFGINVLT